MANSPRIMVVLPPELLRRLEEEAKMQRRPTAQLARIYIEDGLNRAKENSKNEK